MVIRACFLSKISIARHWKKKLNSSFLGEIEKRPELRMNKPQQANQKKRPYKNVILAFIKRVIPHFIRHILYQSYGHTPSHRWLTQQRTSFKNRRLDHYNTHHKSRNGQRQASRALTFVNLYTLTPRHVRWAHILWKIGRPYWTLEVKN